MLFNYDYFTSYNYFISLHFLSHDQNCFLSSVGVFFTREQNNTYRLSCRMKGIFTGEGNTIREKVIIQFHCTQLGWWPLLAFWQLIKLRNYVILRK